MKSLADIVDLCAANRDVKLKALTRNFVKLVRLEPGRLDVGLSDGAPATLLNELAVKLKEWTGIHWIVSLSKEAAQPTLVEQEAAQHGARILDAKSDPDVAAILARFPGAKVTDVRIRAPEPEEEEVEIKPPAVIETDEGDILPGDDIEF